MARRDARFEMRWFRNTSGGFTFIELIVATAVIMVLASAALPLARVSIRRQKEVALRQTLREVRNAIDTFKRDADGQIIAMSELQFGAENYPASLDQLVQGVARANDATGRKLKYLRRIPIDPITGTTDWGMRSYQDSATSTAWGGQSLYDIYSKAEGKALDGTRYKDW
jgi:general secretion pathway protein G